DDGDEECSRRQHRECDAGGAMQGARSRGEPSCGVSSRCSCRCSFSCVGRRGQGVRFAGLGGRELGKGSVFEEVEEGADQLHVWLLSWLMGRLSTRRVQVAKGQAVDERTKEAAAATTETAW